MIKIQKYCFGEANKDLVQNTFIFSRMLIEGYIVIFVDLYRVKCVLENCQRFYFGIEEHYVVTNL